MLSTPRTLGRQDEASLPWAWQRVLELSQVRVCWSMLSGKKESKGMKWGPPGLADIKGRNLTDTERRRLADNILSKMMRGGGRRCSSTLYCCHNLDDTLFWKGRKLAEIFTIRGVGIKPTLFFQFHSRILIELMLSTGLRLLNQRELNLKQCSQYSRNCRLNSTPTQQNIG